MRDLRSTIRPLAVVAAFVALASAPGACSLIVEGSEMQCQTDADCVRFPGSRCDVSGGVCVPADGGADGDGCNGDC